MAIYKDKIIIVDLEATCWDGFKAPPGQTNEIIEVGVCLLDAKTHEISDKRGLLVKPTESIISPFCTQLTSITPELVEREGTDFDTACTILEKEYNSRNRLWVSWGAFDRRMFFDQCKRRNVRYPLNDKHANLKKVFQIHYGERKGLPFAFEQVGLTMEGTHHRGVDDAYNIARLLGYMLQEKGAVVLKKYGL